jgi:hypothetical protein
MIKKIEELNKYCKYSLGFTYYLAVGWTISSYKKGTLFCVSSESYKKNNGYLEDKSFKKLVDKAYQIMLNDKAKKGKK